MCRCCTLWLMWRNGMKKWRSFNKIKLHDLLEEIPLVSICGEQANTQRIVKFKHIQGFRHPIGLKIELIEKGLDLGSNENFIQTRSNVFGDPTLVNYSENLCSCSEKIDITVHMNFAHREPLGQLKTINFVEFDSLSFSFAKRYLNFLINI